MELICGLAGITPQVLEVWGIKGDDVGLLQSNQSTMKDYPRDLKEALLEDCRSDFFSTTFCDTCPENLGTHLGSRLQSWPKNVVSDFWGPPRNKPKKNGGKLHVLGSGPQNQDFLEQVEMIQGESQTSETSFKNHLLIMFHKSVLRFLGTPLETSWSLAK